MAGYNDEHAVVTRIWPSILVSSTEETLQAEWQALSQSGWELLIHRAELAGLAPMLYQTLLSALDGQESAESLSPHAVAGMQTLKAAYRKAALIAMQRIAELRRLLDALNQAGICPVVFKGAHLAHTLYPTPACRPMGDVDLWVTHAEMPAAIAALETLGYQMAEKERRPHALTQHTDGEVRMVSHQVGQGLVELHWGVFPGEWLANAADIDRPGIRSRLTPTTLLERAIQRLAPEDALIQIAVHISINHQMTANVLRSLLDIALLAQEHVDWHVVAERATAWRVATAVGFTLDLARQLFALPALPEAIRPLVPTGVQRSLLNRFVSSHSILADRQLSASRLRLLYLLWMTDRPQDSLRLLTHSAWPSDAWLAARYGRSDWAIRIRHAVRATVGNV